MANYSLRVGPSSTPAWMSGLSLNVWKELTGTTVSTFSDSWGSSAAGVLNDYSGFTLVETANKVYGILRGGGHSGRTSNETLKIEFTADVPVISTLMAPTPSANRIPQDGTAVWFQSLPDQELNIGHTYDTGIWCESLQQILYFELINIAGAAGGTLSTDIFSIDWATKKWIQSNAGNYLGAGKGGATVCQDANGKFYKIPSGDRKIWQYTIGSGWTLLADDNLLNNNGWGVLLYDSTRNKLWHYNDRANYHPCSITMGGVVTDVFSSLSGAAATDLMDQTVCGYEDGTSACYDPINDRFLVKTVVGGDLIAVNAGTWAVTRISPSTVSGTVADQTGKRPGHLRYSNTLKCLFYVPNGESNFWAMRLA